MDQKLDGRYEILHSIGKGGFGETFLARDLRIPGSPHCVVKQLHPANPHPQAMELAQQLFQREAETLARLGHHGQIPRLLAYFSENQEFYLVEDYIEGQSLEVELKAQQPWSEAQVIHLIQEILEVLVFVHEQGVIHRDLKPGNLIRRQSDGKLVLIDFGAIKQVQHSPSDVSMPMPTGTQIGTLGFMPPEQAQGKPRPSSDIYALGMIAIQALTGLPAYGLPDDPQTGEVIWQSQAPVSPQFASIISKMVKYHFQYRFQSAVEVQLALKHYADSQSLQPEAKGSPPVAPLGGNPAGRNPAGGIVANPALNTSQPTVAVSPGYGSSSGVGPQARETPNNPPPFRPAPSRPAPSRPAPFRPASSPPQKKGGGLSWLIGLGLAVLIPVVGGGIYLFLSSPRSLFNPIGTSKDTVKEPCSAIVFGNIRSTPTSYQGGSNIVQTAQGQRFELGQQETPGGWIEIQLKSGQRAWAHLNVVQNESELVSCMQSQGIALQKVADIPPPSPPPKPIPPTPTVSETAAPEDEASKNDASNGGSSDTLPESEATSSPSPSTSPSASPSTPPSTSPSAAPTASPSSAPTTSPSAAPTSEKIESSQPGKNPAIAPKDSKSSSLNPPPEHKS